MEADVPTLTVAEVSESSGDEGEDGADEERDELDKIEAEERKSLQGDDRVLMKRFLAWRRMEMKKMNSPECGRNWACNQTRGR